MAKLPEKIKQIAIVHAHLINAVISCCQNKKYLNILEPELIRAQNNGWIELVKVIRKILKGNRDTKLLMGLDEEDAGIILSILVGLQNPNELPKLNQVNKADYAPEAIAKLIKSFHENNLESKKFTKNMLSQMKKNGHDMKIMAEIVEKLCHKNFDINSLREKMSEDGKKLIDKILEKLK